MKADLRPEHAWLEQLVGEWRYRGTCAIDDKGTEVIMEGREAVRSLGGAFVIGEGVVAMPDGEEARTLLTIGFDPKTGRFTGSWAGSMMTHFWIYDGWLDEAKRTLILESPGPSFAGDGGTSLYRDCFEIVGPDEKILHARVQEPDGTWREFMTSRYVRAARAAA